MVHMDGQSIRAMVNVEFWVHRHDRIDLSMKHPTFFEVAIRIFVLTDFLAQIPNSHFHCPLRVTGEWTCTDGLKGDMGEEMDAVLNKMNPKCLILVVNGFKFPDKILEDCIAISKVLWCNYGTLEYLNPSNQFAVVFPVDLRKNMLQ